MVLLLAILPLFLALKRPETFKAAQTCRKFDSILIDVENLRGKSGFSYSHDEILRSLATWTILSELEGKVTLVIDHGSEASEFWLHDKGYAISFAGPTWKADDVLANECIPFFSQKLGLDTCVVTADEELMKRCKRNSKHNFQIVPPLKLLEDLDGIPDSAHLTLQSESTLSNEYTNETQFPEFEQLNSQITLGAKLLEAESLLRMKQGAKNKKRKKLRHDVHQLREKLAKSDDILARVTTILDKGANEQTLQGMNEQEQNVLLERWKKIRQSSHRKEQTGDRIILAEALRRNLTIEYGLFNGTTSGEHDRSIPSALAFLNSRVVRGSTLISESSAQNKKPQDLPHTPQANTTLRLVIISDTHGFEESLGEQIPHGDVLLHLGDFALDEGPLVKQSVIKFDRWLAKQSHPTKIVLRGNHDPWKCKFLDSGATFVTKATCMELVGPQTAGNYSLALVPYCRGDRLMEQARGLPLSYDILASHVPPRGILDRCYTGELAGSGLLRQMVEAPAKVSTASAASKPRGIQRTSVPPLMWLCGHIHEGRGWLRHVFASPGGSSSATEKERLLHETLVVNAANANTGMATHIEHGPVIVDLSLHQGSEKRVALVSMGQDDTDSSLHLAEQQERMNYVANQQLEFFNEATDGLLLAVDLGLRTGVSLFNEKGQLLRYQAFHFGTAQELQTEATRILDEWAAAIEVEEGVQGVARISRIAIEGGDPPLRAAWLYAAKGRNISILNVKPEQWRDELLIAKEKLDGPSAKAASRLIARQIVGDYGIMPLHDGKFRTDAAESVVMGLHVSRRLGWIARTPAVRRFTNGSVVVPKSRV